MRETLFIKNNKEKWEEYTNNPTSNPAQLSTRFISLVDDLAYAQTYYPKSKTVLYLNERVVTFYNQIYKRKREPLSKLGYYWAVTLPLVIYRNRKFIGVTAVLFFVFVLMGTISAANIPNFFDAIQPGYLKQTRHNIQIGDPFGIFSGDGKLKSFLELGLHNISLAFTIDFLGGMFMGLLNTYSLLLNGMMVGGFHYMFYEAGLGWQFVLVVMIHGVFELFAVILAVAAGYRLLVSALQRGTYTWLQSVKQGAADGMQLMVLVFILLFFAAYLEGNITRLTAASVATHSVDDFIPIWLSIVILSTCITAILFYFWYYPARVARVVATQARHITNQPPIVLYNV